MPTLSPKTTPYYGGGQVLNPADVIIGSGTPSSKDIQHSLGTLYVDKTNVKLYVLLSKTGGVAGWELLQAGSESFPITPFVVGPEGGYATVQAGITAAEAAGGGIVFIQDGQYTEDLGFAGGVSLALWGSSAAEIIGNQDLPATGALEIRGLKITATSGAGFVSISDGSATLRFIDVIFNITNGPALDCSNWSGDIYMDGVQDVSASSTFGVGSGDFLMKNSSLGTNPTGSNSLAGDSQILSSVLGGVITISGAGTSVTADSLQVAGRIVLQDTSSISTTDCIINSGAASCITIGTGCTASCYDCVFNTSATDAIAGTGDFSHGLITYLNSFGVAAGLNSDSGQVSQGGALQLESYLGVRAQTVTDFAGSVTLTNGTATVLNTNIAAGDKIFLSLSDINGSTALGIWRAVITPATSFTISSLQVATPAATQTGDQSILNYFIVRGL